jgi:AcrR family transcriptional regulator
MSNETPRERRQQRTRDAILEAARKIVQEDGVNALSVREIARRIEYSPAALYEYFGSKEEIVAAICLEGFRLLTLALRAVPPELSPKEGLRALGHRYVQFALEYPDYFLLMFSKLNFNPPPAGTPADFWKHALRGNPAFAELLGAMEKLRDGHEIVARDEEELFSFAMSFWQIVHGIATLGISFGEIIADYPAYVDQALLDHIVGAANRHLHESKVSH